MTGDEEAAARRRWWELGHRPGLDGLRGVAVLLVLAGHLQVPLLDSGGWVGVNLFFVLSGFLITSLLLEEHERTGRINFRAFYIRRARRLLPALAVFLAATAIVSPDPARIAAIALYVGNWYRALTGDQMGIYAHTWSLSVEEQFYIVWPALLLIGLTLARRHMIAFVILGALASALLRFTTDLDRAYVGTDTRADALLVGAALSIAFHRGWVWEPRRITVLLAAFCVFLVASPTGYWQDALAEVQLLWGLPLTAMAGMVLVARATKPGLLDNPFLRWTGRISYSLYLWQEPLLIVAASLAGGSWPVFVVLGLGLSYFAAWVSYRYVETPIRLGSGLGHVRLLDVGVRRRGGRLAPVDDEPAVV